MIRTAAENRKSPQNLICGDFFIVMRMSLIISVLMVCVSRYVTRLFRCDPIEHCGNNGKDYVR